MATTKEERIKNYERSIAYLNNEMYKGTGITKKCIVENIFEGTIPSYNPIPKLLSTMSDLTMANDVVITGDDNGFITEIFNYNKFNLVKSKWLKELLLSKEIYIESLLDNDGEVSWNLHTSDHVEVVKEGHRFLRVTITGETHVYNSSSDQYDIVEVVKTYSIIGENVTVTTVDTEGNILESSTLNITSIPVTYIETSYDLTRAMYITDGINQIEAYKNSMFFHCGEPLLSASGVKSISDTQKLEQIGSDRYKKQKVLYSGFDTKIELLELSGSSAKGMTETQKELKEDMLLAYPELNTSNLTKGSNVSTESVKMKLREVEAKRNSIISSFKPAIIELLEVSAKLKNTELQGTIEFGEMIQDDTSKSLNDINVAIQLGILSKPSAMTKIQSMFLDGSVENEVKRLEEEGITVEADEGVVTNSELPEHSGGKIKRALGSFLKKK